MKDIPTFGAADPTVILNYQYRYSDQASKYVQYKDGNG